MATENTTLPQAGVGDWGHTTAKAVLSAIPIAGGPLSEFFSALLVPPLTKRREEWLQSIADRLKALEGKVEGFSIEALKDNEMFVTVFMHATQIAIRNHQREKIEALRNAVINVALGRAPDEDLQIQAWRVDPGELIFLITGPGSDVYIPSAQNPQFHFHWGKNQQVWNNAGDIACLLRPQGSQLVVVSVLPVPGVPTTSWASRW
jgi:hypothetical protein